MATDDPLDVTVTIRVTTSDAAQLARVVRHHPLAKRGAVAREALRRGLQVMQAEAEGVKGKR